MKSSGSIALLLAAMLSAQSFQPARPGYKYEFPRDHFSHPEYQTEWWYYTGNLHSPEGHRYGFELTFFRRGVVLSKNSAESESAVWRPSQIHLAHLALSDIDGQKFFHTERLNRTGPGLADEREPQGCYWNGNWRVRWTALPRAEQQLEAVADEFTLRLNLQPRKPPVIQGENGISRKGPAPDQASHYVSFTRIAAEGELLRSGTAVRLEGVAWMDHEFFTEQENSDLVGWDWFAIQLDGGEELMLYRLRNKSGKLDAFSSGAYIDAQGKSRFLRVGDFTLSPGELWKSAHSGATYPLEWSIEVPSLGLSLKAQTALKDQELWSEGNVSPAYWEGAVTYDGKLGTGAAKGVGYLEMTGYSSPIHLGGMTPQ